MITNHKVTMILSNLILTNVTVKFFILCRLQLIKFNTMTILCIQSFDIDRSLQRSKLQINHWVIDIIQSSTDDMNLIILRREL